MILLSERLRQYAAGLEGAATRASCEYAEAKCLRDAADELDRTHDRLATAERCNTCGGAPHPSGLTCVCGGTGRAADEVDGPRKAAFRAERERDEAVAWQHAKQEWIDVATRTLQAQLDATAKLTGERDEARAKLAVAVNTLKRYECRSGDWRNECAKALDEIDGILGDAKR